jgi:hypothetical protein
VGSLIVQTTFASPTSAPAITAVERVTGIVDPEFQVSKISNSWLYKWLSKFNNTRNTTTYF